MSRRGFIVGILIGVPIGVLVYKLSLENNNGVKIPKVAQVLPSKPKPATVNKPAIVLNVPEKSSEPVAPDDLKRITGIGPKISNLLNDAGISTFKQLATAELEILEAILEKAGPRFRLADPNDWAKQARELS